MQKADDLLADLLPDALKGAVVELKAYFLGSFGHPVRIDYGTGHEFSFVTFLRPCCSGCAARRQRLTCADCCSVCLFKLGVLTAKDLTAAALQVFGEYVGHAVVAVDSC